MFGSESYLREHGYPKSPADLPRHHLVLNVPAMHKVGPALKWLEDFNREGTIITRVDNLQAASQMIVTGRGLGLLPAFFEQTNPGLVRALPDPVVFSDGYLVYHASLRNVTRIRVALDLLSKAITAHSHLWTGLPSGSGTKTVRYEGSQFVMEPWMGDTGRSVCRNKNSDGELPARSCASQSSGSYSTPIGFAPQCGPHMYALHSSLEPNVSTWNSI